MKPHVICHMMVSLDGRIHPSRWTDSPDGDRKAWTTIYEDVHAKLAGDAWLVGRVTMAEMSKGTAHPPATHGPVERPHHFAKRDAGSFAIAFDRAGKLHFKQADIGGDHVVVLLGPDVPDAHLAELAGDGVSYVVAPDAAMQARPLFELLGRELGIKRLLVEGMIVETRRPDTVSSGSGEAPTSWKSSKSRKYMYGDGLTARRPR